MGDPVSIQKMGDSPSSLQEMDRIDAGVNLNNDGEHDRSVVTMDREVKPLVVRIKRKRMHAPVESVWLEVTDRPAKRQELSLARLSLDDNTGVGAVPEVKTTRMLFHHLETFTSLGVKEASQVNSILKKARDRRSMQERWKEWRQNLKINMVKQGLLLATAREAHQSVSGAARFEQVWRRRRGFEKEYKDDTMCELFHLYDVVRVDNEEEVAESSSRRQQAKREVEVSEGQILCNYLPLLREYLPSAASEIEEDLSSQRDDEDGYVYDVYALEEGATECEGDKTDYPIIQVKDDDDFYWGDSGESEYDSEDSNCENNPQNEYPEEESEFESESDIGNNGTNVAEEEGDWDAEEAPARDAMSDYDYSEDLENCTDAGNEDGTMRRWLQHM
eukprot:c28959_g1_i1 orf=534-1700(+)